MKSGSAGQQPELQIVEKVVYPPVKLWDDMTALERAQCAEQYALLFSHRAESELRNMIASQERSKAIIAMWHKEAQEQRAIADAEMPGKL